MSKESRINYRTSLALVLGLTLLSGIVHGVLDGRWSPSTDMVAIADLLQDVPDQIGDWELIENQELERSAAEQLRCYGSTIRVYKHARSGVSVTVAVLFGPRGPIAVHTPEVCYESVGTKQVGATRRETIVAGAERHGLWSAKFRRVPDPEPSIDVWYAWSDGGNWKDADLPRVWLTDSLYKLQIAGPVGAEPDRPVADFLEVFLPELQKHLR